MRTPFVLKFKTMALGVAWITVSVVSIGRVLPKIKETAVSFVSKPFSTQRLKEGIRCCQKASKLGEIFQTASNGASILESKKAFSVGAAAMVGIGLLTAPIEKSPANPKNPKFYGK